MRYYGHEGDDAIIWQLFEGRETGFFVDVGAHDGWHLSNTLSFELAGWKGICIEPHPFYYQLLAMRRKNSFAIRKLIGDKMQSNVEFWVHDWGGFSSMYEENAVGMEKWRESGRHVITLTMWTLDHVLETVEVEPGTIDFISVDVEKAEPLVLQGFDLLKWRPRLMVLEDGGNVKWMEDYFAKRGYYFAKNHGYNLYFCRDESDVAKIRDYVPTEWYRLPHVLDERLFLCGERHP